MDLNLNTKNTVSIETSTGIAEKVTGLWACSKHPDFQYFEREFYLEMGTKTLFAVKLPRTKEKKGKILRSNVSWLHQLNVNAYEVFKGL